MVAFKYVGIVAACLACAFSNERLTVVSSQDNGKTIKIKAGQDVLIRLPVQRGTGYSWQAPSVGPESLFVVERQKDTSEGPPQPGKKETQAFRLLFKRAGQADLVFQYRRPWDEEGPPAETFRIKVESEKQ